MGWDNPPVPWREFERRLSWRQGQRQGTEPGGGTGTDGEVTPLPGARTQAARGSAGGGSGSSSGSGKRVPWAELHCHSSYSFLDGASAPRDLIREAARLGLTAIAITDHDGMYGVPQFAQSATRFREGADGAAGPATVFGAELSLDIPPARRRAGSSSEPAGLISASGPTYGNRPGRAPEREHAAEREQRGARAAAERELAAEREYAAERERREQAGTARRTRPVGWGWREGRGWRERAAAGGRAPRACGRAEPPPDRQARRARACPTRRAGTCSCSRATRKATGGSAR